LESPEEADAQPYRLKIMSELLIQATVLGIDLEEFAGFFAAQIQAMLACPPNYNYTGKKLRIWLMRGFYPGSPIFFKLSICKLNESMGAWSESYYAKASPLLVKPSKSRKAHIFLEGKELNNNIINRMENRFFGADHKLEPMLPKIKMPRCMSPKGIKIFNYEKPKKPRKKRAKTG
jgi:hypothetical protein